MRLDVDVRNSGPVFDGRAEAAARSLGVDITNAVAFAGYQMVQANLTQRLQHPTGYYQSQLHIVRYGLHAEVTDGGVIYGPWLEGTGSRNRTTRFKGYRSFRKAIQRLRADTTKHTVGPLRVFLQRAN
jgi:hypothetical protein